MSIDPNQITPEMLAAMAANLANSGAANPTILQPGQSMPAMPAMDLGMVQAMPTMPTMPTMPAMDLGMVQAPIQAPVAEQQVQAPVAEQQVQAPIQAPIQAPVAEQQVQAPIQPPIQATVATVASVATTLPEQAPVIQTPSVMDSNGLDLEGMMAPEEVILAQKEDVKPITVNGLQSIGDCKTSAWGAFIKILEFIAKDLGNNDIISIEKGTIDTHKSGIFIHCDMQNILGNISLNLTSPDSSVKLLKLIRGGDLVQIFKEEATNNYVFCNIMNDRILTRVHTKLAANTVALLSKVPELGQPIRQKEISNSDKEILKTIIAGRSAIGTDEPYRFGFSKSDLSLVSIGVGKDFTYFFQDSGIETLEYRCFNPFPVPNMDSCIIKVFGAEEEGKLWLQTVSNIEISSIICTEYIEVINSEIEDYTFM